jgi:hypothetical protein
MLSAVLLTGCGGGTGGTGGTGDSPDTESGASPTYEFNGETVSATEAFEGIEADGFDRYAHAVERAGGQLTVTMKLSKTDLTDDDLAALVLPQSVTSLDLSNTKITDAGLAHLKKWPQLTKLNLCDNGHTDAAVEHLLALPNLTQVAFHHPDLSPAKYKELMSALRARRLRAREQLKNQQK